LSGDHVVIYGTGAYAESVFEALNKKYSPVACCDKELKDHLRHFFMGLPLFLVEQVEARYPACLYYLAVDQQSKPSAIESLIGKGIDRSRIINFEVYKRYDSCPEVEGSLCISLSEVRPLLSFYCSGLDESQSLGIRIESNAYDAAIQRFFAKRDKIIETINLSSGTELHCPCSSCLKVKDGLWSANRQVRVLYIGNPNYNHIHRCNPSSDGSCALGTDLECVLSFIRFLKGKGIIDTSTEIHLQADELQNHPQQDELFSEVQDNPCTIHTNAHFFSEKMDEMMSINGARLYVSVDAGTPQTFAEVWGADAFDEVCKNLQKYSMSGFTHLRYNVLPCVNDNNADIDGFIDLCVRLNVNAVDVSRDRLGIASYSDHAIEAVGCLIVELRKKKGGSIHLLDDTFLANPMDLRRIKEEILKRYNVISHDVAAICCAEARQSRLVVYTCAYNAENTLVRTIESVLSQTFGDFTYYIVDNGSIDATSEIIRHYADLDNRVVPLANVRNTVWKLGNRFQNLVKWHTVDSHFCLLDADDEYKPDFLKITLSFAQQSDLDIVVAGSDYYEAESGHIIEHKKTDTDLILEGRAFADEFINYRSHINALWNKLYKSTIILQLGIPHIEMSFAQDSVLMLMYLMLSSRVGFLSQSLHRYRVHPKSSYNSFNSNRLNDCHLLFRYYAKFLERFGTISLSNLDYLYAIWLGWMNDFIFRPLCATDLSATKKLHHVSRIFESDVTKGLLHTQSSDPRFQNLVGNRESFLQNVRAWIYANSDSATELGKSLALKTLKNMDISSKEPL